MRVKVIVITLKSLKGVFMKTFFMTLVLLSSISSFAETPTKTMKDRVESTPQTQVLPKAAPGASTPARENTEPEPTATNATAPQLQEQSPGEENKFKVGPYNKNGDYIFFDRLELEKRQAEEEQAEQQ